MASVGSRLKSWLSKVKSNQQAQQGNAKPGPNVSKQNSNPVSAYYQSKIQANLPEFYRFALQSRSLLIRNVFAKAASSKNYDLTDLLVLTENHDIANLSEVDKSWANAVFDGAVVLSLADLIANTARDDIDTALAARLYDLSYVLFGLDAFSNVQKLQYVEALSDTKRYQECQQKVREFGINDIAPLQPELLEIQRIRGTSDCEHDWANAINELYLLLGMAPIALSSDQSLPLMDRLESGASELISGPKVSIIMPTYSPGPGIRTAVRSLLQQTWQNLEIIIVDDASPAGFKGIFQELQELDPRIRVLHQANNSGAYVARNAGLGFASGVFVTTHDDDDWSHPDKIAEQVAVMLEDESIVATTSAHIRVTQQMFFRRVNLKPQYKQMNYSSLMFRKQIIDQIGPWDTVNRGGDSELYTRIIEHAGSRSIIYIEKPLSFSRVWAGSLTSGEMVRGYFAYSRILYRWSFRQWHWACRKRGDKPVQDLTRPRPYAVPTTFEAGDRSKDLGCFDVVYVADFFRQAKNVNEVLQEIETLSESSFRIGFIHLQSPQTVKPAGIPDRLFELQLRNKVTQLSHDDVAETRLLVVYDASIGMFLDQLRSNITVHRSIVVDQEEPRLIDADKRLPVAYGQALALLDACFHTSFEIVGASSYEQNKLRACVPKSRLLKDEFIWRDHVRDEANQIKPPEGSPVVGFHSYGNKFRWPKDTADFRNVYISNNFQTLLYGNVNPALKQFGKDALAETKLLQKQECTEQDFLRSLDFWVYYPNDKLQDRIWHPVLRAMQSGLVVILPERLSSLYKDAAVYAPADKVSEVVAHFSGKPSAYIAQAERGQRFVASSFSREVLVDKVHQLLDVNINN